MDDAALSNRLERIVERLLPVDGIVGVVLGGSRARGTDSPDSDYDVGVYYAGEDVLDIAALDAAAGDLDDDGRSGLIAPPGSWGNWVNGGGWLTVGGAAVDIILRDVRRVEQAVGDCLAGRVHPHYQTGHPHAYLNVMYAGELAIARIEHDPDGALRALREKLSPYPEALKNALVRLFDFEAGFSLMLARAGAARGDEYYVAAHVARALSCLNQVLFAVNETYCINEKKAVAMIDAFLLRPSGYAFRVGKVVSRTGTDSARACDELESLVEEARLLLPTIPARE